MRRNEQTKCSIGPGAAKPITSRASKMNADWWKTYEAVFKALHGRASDKTEYSPKAGDATNAAFEALGLPRYVKSD